MKKYLVTRENIYINAYILTHNASEERTRQPFWKIAREAGLSRATVARIAKTKG